MLLNESEITNASKCEEHKSETFTKATILKIILHCAHNAREHSERHKRSC